MRKFILRTIIFLIIPVLYFVVNHFINYFLYKDPELKIRKKNILIAGDSHPQKSINPNLFYDALNISQLAEPYILTFWKLKTIYKLSPPDTLILGFGPHNISKFNDYKFSNHWSNKMFQRCYPIEEFDRLPNSIEIDYRSYYKVLWKETALYPKTNHVNYIGSYSQSSISSENNLNDWSFVINRHYFKEDQKLGFSDVAINYLDSVINLSKSYKVEVILVSSPVHSNYYNNIPNSILDRYINLVENYNKQYTVFNKTNHIIPDSLFSNSDHLNHIGAHWFTEQLIDSLEKTRNSFH